MGSRTETLMMPNHVGLILFLRTPLLTRCRQIFNVFVHSAVTDRGTPRQENHLTIAYPAVCHVSNVLNSGNNHAYSKQESGLLLLGRRSVPGCGFRSLRSLTNILVLCSLSMYLYVFRRRSSTRGIFLTSRSRTLRSSDGTTRSSQLFPQISNDISQPYGLKDFPKP